MDKNWRSLVVELVGSFVVVFVGAAAVCSAYLGSQTGPLGLGGVAVIGAARGLALAAALAVGLPHGTGFFNPAVTITLWVFKRFDGLQAGLLVFVQLLGATIAGGVVRLVFGGSDVVMAAAHMGTPHLNAGAFDPAGVTPWLLMTGIAMEICLTFVLTIVVFGTLIDPRAPRLLGKAGVWLAPLWVGVALFAITLAGFNVTGAAANPARWFGTVIWEKSVEILQVRNPFADNMAYWIGPIVGALIAGSLYSTLVLPAEGTAPPAAAPAAGRPPTIHGTLFRSKK